MLITKEINMNRIPKGAKLSEDMKKKLMEHAKKHTKRHINSMRMHLLKGKSFEEAHKVAKD